MKGQTFDVKVYEGAAGNLGATIEEHREVTWKRVKQLRRYHALKAVFADKPRFILIGGNLPDVGGLKLGC